MTIQDVQRRLKKLLALSSSSCTAEAESAMNKASELMEKHSIRTIDVDIDTNTVGIATYSMNGYTVEHEGWESALAASIADPFDGKAIIHHNFEEGRWCLIFVSSASENQIIVDLYKRLRRTVSKLSKEFAMSRRKGDKAELQKSYAYGMVSTIHSRLITLYTDDVKTRALVLVKNDAIDTRIKEMFGEIKNSDNPSITNKRAYLKGAKDGNDLNLHKSLNTKREQPLINKT